MKKRYLYSLLFGVPGFFVAGIIAVAAFAAGTGILWIYFLGDNPWPASTEKLLSAILALIFLLLWGSFIAMGFVTGKRLEKDPRLNKGHILLSSGLTLLFILFIAIQQFSVGNLGPKSDGVVCSDYCSLRGYSGSGMPPQNSGDRSCSCYDNLGNEVLKVPLVRITPGAAK